MWFSYLALMWMWYRCHVSDRSIKATAWCVCVCVGYSKKKWNDNAAFTQYSVFMSMMRERDESVRCRARDNRLNWSFVLHSEVQLFNSVELSLTITANTRQLLTLAKQLHVKRYHSIEFSWQHSTNCICCKSEKKNMWNMFIRVDLFGLEFIFK